MELLLSQVVFHKAVAGLSSIICARVYLIVHVFDD